MAKLEDTLKKLEELEKAKLELLDNLKKMKTPLSNCPNCNNKSLTTKPTTVNGRPGFFYECLHCKYSTATH